MQRSDFAMVVFPCSEVLPSIFPSWIISCPGFHIFLRVEGCQAGVKLLIKHIVAWLEKGKEVVGNKNYIESTMLSNFTPA